MKRLTLRTFPVHRSTLAPILAVASIAALAVGLAGCGGSSPVAKPAPAPLTANFLVLSSASTGHLPTAVAGSPYAYGFQTNVGLPGVPAVAPISWRMKGNAPAGLTLSSQGVLEGTPTAVGQFPVTVEAVDSSPQPITADFTYLMQVQSPGAVLTQVAHSDLGGAGQNADITVATATNGKGTFAYVGTRGSLGDCPASGVKIVALAQITNPQVVARAGGVTGAGQPEAAVVTGASSPAFHPGATGDLMAVAEQPCDPRSVGSRQAGIALFDVSDPAHPVALGTWSSGGQGVGDVAFVPVAGPANAFGQVDHSQDKIYILAAVPGSEAAGGEGDLRIIDASNPASPQEVRNWGVLAATATPLPQAVQGVDQRVFLSSIKLSSDRHFAYLGYWDEGVVVLDVSDPLALNSNNPAVFVNHITYPVTSVATTSTPSSPEGNTHLALPVLNDTELLVTDQVCATGTPANPAINVVCGANSAVPLTDDAPWGFLRTYSLPTPSSAAIESFYVTPQSVSDPAPDTGIYTAHNAAWNGDVAHPHAYVAWYSSGVVDLDITSIAPPTPLASFTPPDTADPNGSNPAVDNPAKAMVVGVAAYSAGGQRYILASDINSGLWVVQETAAPQLALLTTALPSANVGQPYFATLTAANGSVGNSMLSFRLAPNSNPLPSGLSLDSSGNLTGTAQAAGTVAVTFQVDDGAGHSAQQTITMTVVQNLAIVPQDLNKQAIQPANIPPATVNEPYSLTLTAVNGTSPYTFTAKTPLPVGLSISTAGVISGTAQVVGTTNSTIQVTDSSVPVQTATLVLPIQVAGLQPKQEALLHGTVGQTYADVISMLNGTPPFTPQLASGGLPPGITVQANPNAPQTWNFSGTPTRAGTYNFSIRITDGTGLMVVQPYTLIVDPFEVTPAFLPAAAEGRGYLQDLTVQGGQGPYTFAVVLGALPKGLTIDPNTGTVRGVPASGTAGQFPITLLVTDSNGLTTNKSYTVVVFQGTSLAVTTTGLAPAVAGQTVTESVAADFGTPPYTFTLLTGSLPTGVTLSPSGALTGVPAVAASGNYGFTVKVTDSTGAAATAHFTWMILPPNSSQ